MATTSAYVDLGYPSNSSQVWSYFDSPQFVAELNCGLAYLQSRSSGRFPSTHVIVPNLSSAPRSNSDSEPRINLGDKNDIELGKVVDGKPGVPYEF